MVISVKGGVAALPFFILFCKFHKKFITLKQIILKPIFMMKTSRVGVYIAPVLKDLKVYVEQGFAISDNFEQPEYGGEDNL